MRTIIDAISHKTALVGRHAGVWIGLTFVVAVSWYFLVRMDTEMTATGAGTLVPGEMVTESDALAQLSVTMAMWAIMMVAMMLPTLPPSVLMFTTLAMRRDPSRSRRATTLYVTGYTASWIGFAVPAAALQWGLTSVSLLDPLARSTSTGLNAAVLLAAGLYQFSPIKRACLSKCRTPLGFFIAHWRDGARGAVTLGLLHGGYCIACCWTLMLAMFAVGAMNLAWMVFFTLVVLGEKTLPTLWRFDRAVGATLIASGLWVTASAWAGT